MVFENGEWDGEDDMSDGLDLPVLENRELARERLGWGLTGHCFGSVCLRTARDAMLQAIEVQ
jgi:hypothetical protein